MGILLLLLAFAGWVIYGRIRERSRFGEVRPYIRDLMRTYGISKYELLTRAQRPRMPGHAADLTRYLAEANLEANA